MSNINTEAMPGHDCPWCAACKHLTKMGTQDGLGWTCKAFPEGISPTIVDGTDLHTSPIPGDNGLQFEPLEG